MRVQRVIALAIASLAAGMSLAVNIYQNDFETGTAAGFSYGPVATAPNASTKFLGRLAGESGNTSTSISFSGLAAHSTITVAFDLYIIQSWDGTGNMGSGPDGLRFAQDGNPFVDATFASNWGPTQSYSDATPLGGGPFAGQTSADAFGTLGYPNFFGTDATYNMSFTFAHSATTLVLDFQGINLQGVSDESWGLDNFVVSSDAVPEPATVSVLALALAGLGRRRRTRS